VSTPARGDGYDAVVVAGGGARRMGGADKPAVTVGGRPLLDRVLAACSGAARTIVVGPRRPTCRPVVWAREEPPGGGPLAALAAGLRHVTGGTVLVLSADLPFLRPGTVAALLAPDAGAEGAVVHDGRDQPLVAAYRTGPLRREIALLHAEHGRLSGLPLRLLLPALRLRRVPASREDVLDCDTWEDIGAARARIREHGTVLDEWTAAVKAELDIDLDVDITALLGAARDAAHGVTRPAAPLTTFLVGYAAGRGDGSPEAVADAVRRVTELVKRWEAE
jgi:molybdopterin-guanine dinucleotide biosynthesis protein A